MNGNHIKAVTVTGNGFSFTITLRARTKKDLAAAVKALTQLVARWNKDQLELPL